jgi:putative Mg2+ transporter-C (MgtC) family protein
MPLHLDAQEIILRLVLAIVAGALIGLDREAKGRPAGLRTTVLVAMAAALAMIQMNILLAVGGKGPDSFSVMDVMRLPLGILSGMGFIGGAAILRRDEGILGVTTAATLWITTVLGLCFGGGQLFLGSAGTVLAVIVLRAFRSVEDFIYREHRALLIVKARAEIDVEDAAISVLNESGIEAKFVSAKFDAGKEAEHTFDVRWLKKGPTREPTDCLWKLRSLAGILFVEWKGSL